MKKPLAHTKVTVKLRKSQYKEEWYLIVEAYPVVKAGNKVERIVESVNRTITTPIWDKSSSPDHPVLSPNETSMALLCAVLPSIKNLVSMQTT